MPNPVWMEGLVIHQIQVYGEFTGMLKESQLDVNLSNITRISASAFNTALDKRREKVLDKIKRNNKLAATAINRILAIGPQVVEVVAIIMKLVVLNLFQRTTSEGETLTGVGGGRKI